MSKPTIGQGDYPYFLKDYATLSDHFRDEFESLSSQDRGRRFASFVIKLTPHTQVGERFHEPRSNQETHDEGVDLVADSDEENESLYIQSKYNIRKVDDIDQIISKFEGYEQKKKAKGNQPRLIEDEKDKFPILHFMIVTSRDVQLNIIPAYEKQHRSSLSFYHTLKDQGRLHIVDGPEILNILQNAYRKEHFLPSSFDLTLDTPFIEKNDVFIGILAGTELKKLHSIFGNSLFLENVREYLGMTSGKAYRGKDRVTVNEKIIETLQTEPEKFLARNNGITIRANVVEVLANNQLRLKEASIVNGCQTTMSIVKHPNPDSFVLVKVVQVLDSWDIAKASNFQNEIHQIDLELARYIRPQAIKRAAVRTSTKFVSASEEASAYAILDSIYENRVTYEEIRCLFLGLFSRSPNNALEANYAELLTTVIQQLFEEDPQGESTFDILFKLHNCIKLSSQETLRNTPNPQMRHMFQRFWKEEKPSYRIFLGILAACVCVGENIYTKSPQIEYAEMRQFLKKIQVVIDTDVEKFISTYHLAFKLIANDLIINSSEELFLKELRDRIERLKFNQFYLSTSSW
jgi:hypothetical protein